MNRETLSTVRESTAARIASLKSPSLAKSAYQTSALVEIIFAGNGYPLLATLAVPSFGVCWLQRTICVLETD